MLLRDRACALLVSRDFWLRYCGSEDRLLPHVLIEYSSNLEGLVDFPRFLTALRDSALSTGVFPLGGIRVRAYRADHYVVADGHADNSFVHVMLRVGHGRDLETRKRACDAIFAKACQELGAVYETRPLGISLEMQEVDAVLTCKQNNLHEYVRRRQAGAADTPANSC